MHKGFILFGTILFTVAALLVLSQVTSGNRRRFSFDGPSIFSIDLKKDRANTRKTISPGLEHIVIKFTENGMQGECDLFKIDQNYYTMTIKNSEENPRLVSEWARDYPFKEGLIINGAFFLEDFKSCGYLVIDNELIQPKKVDQKKSGLIVINGDTLEIRDLSVRPIKKEEDFEFAIQSYPMVIKEGLPNIKEDSGLAARRTLLGIDFQDNIYVISLTSYKATLFNLMRHLTSSGIHFKYVLNLDGGISSGYLIRTGGKTISSDSYGVVPNVLMFVRK